ncbi:MAG: DHA2 family efflux MFS transporter permease subunit [Phyllobacteriaceae bacterium]|nr:DHA2 family efflux MFS transporter permease subunit [Phyllobacteriaceae bacterium]
MTLGASRTIPLIVAIGLFMEHLDSTIIATALPRMAIDLGLPPVRLNLAITAYLVAMAVFIPASGWIADRFGARRVFVGAMGLFVTGSLVCGGAPSLGVLIAGRLLQGLGGALMTPVGRLVMLRSVPRAELVSAMAWLTIPALIGPVVGPPLGGLITTVASWRWIFWINLPIGLVGMVVALALLPSIREERVPPFDGVGFVASAVGLSALVFAFETAGRDVVPASVDLLAMAVGLVLVVFYVRRARRMPAPLIDLGLLRLPTFAAAVWGGSVFRLGVGALAFLLPLQLQIGFGRSALESGLTTFVSAIGAITMKVTAKRVIDRLGFRTTLVGGAVLAGGFLAIVGVVGPATPVALLMTLLLFGGFFRSLEFTAINAVAFSDVTEAEMSRATAFSSMMQQLSLSAGVALGATTLHVLSAGSPLPPTAFDFSIALGLIGAASMLSAPLFARLPSDAGAALIDGEASRRPGSEAA